MLQSLYKVNNTCNFLHKSFLQSFPCSDKLKFFLEKVSIMKVEIYWGKRELFGKRPGHNKITIWSGKSYNPAGVYNTARLAKSVRTAISDTKYTIYLSLCTQSTLWTLFERRDVLLKIVFLRFKKLSVVI